MKNFKLIFLCLLFYIFSVSMCFGQQEQSLPNLSSILNFSIDMQWFLSYQYGEEREKSFNQFTLKRGYVNIKKKINQTFSGRITTDLTVDREGDGEGDVELRLKYLYLNYVLPSISFLYKPSFEIGLAHRPWLDFEEHINLYRLQGTMFLERNHILNSGDFGVVFLSLLGGEVDKQYQKSVSKNYPGKYGSVALGIFNGGGYHSLEKNENKTIEGRITIRPLYSIIQGLQLTYHGVNGKGNIEEASVWYYNSGYISWQNTNITLTGQYIMGSGNSSGSAIQDTLTFDAVDYTGYSLFGEWHILLSKFSLFGRYDYFNQEFKSGDLATKRIIAGVALYFAKDSKIILDYDKQTFSKSVKKGSDIIEVAIELKY